MIIMIATFLNLGVCVFYYNRMIDLRNEIQRQRAEHEKEKNSFRG